MKILKRFGRRSKTKQVRSLEYKKAITISHIAILGYSDAPANDPLFRHVIEVSKTLAMAGYVIVDGGGPGVMRAATIGAKEVGGKVIGVTLYPKDMTHFEGRDPKNDFDVEIRTSNYVQRTLTLMREGQVFVFFNGGTGTISEFGMAWGLARLYFGHHKPLILYGKFWKKIMTAFRENMMIRPEELKVFKIVENADQVLDAIKEFEIEIARGDHSHHLKTTRGDFSI